MIDAQTMEILRASASCTGGESRVRLFAWTNSGHGHRLGCRVEEWQQAGCTGIRNFLTEP